MTRKESCGYFQFYCSTEPTTEHAFLPKLVFPRTMKWSLFCYWWL